MTERKLKINLEGLWNNPQDLFTVRYKDINLKYQQILAKRIKEIAPYTSIKRPSGPTTEIIEQVLHEINPIIFSEYIGDGRWYRNHQVFGISPAVYTAGYRFKMLCRAIFLLTCRKKALTPYQITLIARLTHNWQIVEPYVNQRLGIANEETETATPIEDLGIEDVHRAGENIRNDQNNGTFTPDTNYDTPPTIPNVHMNENGDIRFDGNTLRIMPVLQYIPSLGYGIRTTEALEQREQNTGMYTGDQLTIEARNTANALLDRIANNLIEADEEESND